MTGTTLALIRHGPTEWNAAGRMQGRADLSLSAAGRREVSTWDIPAQLRGARWASSPLRRARETGEILSGQTPEAIAALMEMDWGDWEGFRLPELRDKFGTEMILMEAAGLDFQPPGGESPRQVWQRLHPWLCEIADYRGTIAAVTHKGVIRTVFAHATGWDMTGKPPIKLDWRAAHLFSVGAGGDLSASQLNLSLVE